MSSYFVSSAGSNSNAGTIGSPFLTVTHAASVIASSNDVINLNGGDTFNENPPFADGTGCTIQSYGTGQGHIAGAGTAGTLSFLSPAGPLVLDNVIISNPDITNSFFNINITYANGVANLDGLTVSGCTITGGFVCLRTAITVGTFVGNVLIENNIFSGGTNSAVTISANSQNRDAYGNLNITGNLVSNIPGYSSSNSSGVGILVEGTNGSMGPNYIQFNEIFDCGADANDTTGAGGPAGLFPFFADSVIGQYNVVHDMFSNAGGGGSADGIGIDIDVGNTNCQLLYNYCYNCQGPGITHLSAFVPGTKNVIAFNICVNCGLDGADGAQILCFDTGGALDCYNNTIISSAPFPTVAFTEANATLNKRFFNNIFIAPPGIPTVNIVSGIAVGNLVMDGNYHQSGSNGFAASYQGTTYTSLSAWQSATGLETHGVAASNLRFVQPQPPPALTPTSMAGGIVFSPISGSPVFNAGVSLIANGITPLADFLGNPWTQNTIGAIYVPGVPNNFISVVYELEPLALFRLGEPGTGQVSPTQFVDSLSNIQSGVWTAATQGVTPIVAGDGGLSLGSNGSSTSGVSNNSPSTGAFSFTGFTVALTASFDTFSPSQQYLITSSSTPQPNSDFILEVVTGGIILFNLADHAGNIITSEATIPSAATSTPYRITATWVGGDTVKIYVNGEPQTVTYGTRQSPTSIFLTQIFLANANVGGVALSGSMADVAIYPTVLTDAQVLTEATASLTPTYSVTGPTSTAPGVTSANFTITPTGFTTNDTLTLTSAHSNTITQSSISVTSSATYTFTVEGSTIVQDSITITSANSATVFGSPIAFGIAQPFTVSITGTVLQGQPITATYTPSGTTTDVVTPSDGQAGTFSPATLTFTGSSSAQTTQYTPAVSGLVSVSGSSSLGAAFTPASDFSYGVTLDAYLWQSATAFLLGSFTQTIQGNNNYAGAPIFIITGTPEFFVNGDSVQVGDPIYATQITPFAAYPALCGGVRILSMVNAALSTFTGNLTFAWTGDGGGSGLVLANSGVGTTQVGITGYTITDFGTGYTVSFMIPVPGQSPTIQALAYVTVVDNVVTAVAPASGAIQAYGEGYTGTSMDGVALPGSGAFGGNGGTFNNQPVPGSGLIVNCVIGNYGVPPEVSDSGSAFVSMPTFTVKDSGGTVRATCIPIMTGPSPSDTLTFTAPAGLFATAIPAPLINALPSTIFAGGGPTPPATNATVTNFAGQLEGPVGHAPGFLGPYTMPAGTNSQLNPTAFENNVYLVAKNKFKGANPWLNGFACNDVAIDSNYYPAFWTPNSWVTSACYGGITSISQAQYQGTWAFQYDDDFYGGIGSQSHPAFATIIDNQFGNPSSGVTWIPVNGPFATLPTVTGTTVIDGEITAIAFTAGSGLEGVLVTIADSSGSNAAFVGIVVGGVLTSLVQLCGGTSYSSPTVTLTPVAVSGGVVTVKYASEFTPPNAGGFLALVFCIVSGADTVTGTALDGHPVAPQHCHNPFLFAPGNTIDRSNPYATDDNVVAARTKNGNGPGVQRYMNVFVGPGDGNIADPSDIFPGTLYSWDYYPTFDGNVLPGPPNSPTFSGTCTAGSATITGIADTSILTAGQILTGPGIIGGLRLNNFTNIASVDSSTQITITIPAILSGAQTLSVNPTPAGTAIFNFAREYLTNPAASGITWTPSGNIYSSNNMFNTGTDSFGPFLTITNGPAGATDNGLFVTHGTSDQSIGLVELRSIIPHGLKTGTDASLGQWTSQQQFTGTTTNGSFTITGAGVSGGNQRVVGQQITGSGIPAGSTISLINSSTSITFTNSSTTPATASATVTLTSTQVIDWSVSGVSQFSAGNPGFVSGVFWVTGPNTVVVQYQTAAAAGSGTNQTPLPTNTEIPVYLTYALFAPYMSFPLEFIFSDAGQYPKCLIHLQMPYFCSDATLQYMAQLKFQYAPNANVRLERGNEHWNTASAGVIEAIVEGVFANAVNYFPVGTPLFPHFTPSGSTESYITDGSGIAGGRDGAYVILSANQEYVFINGLVEAGGSASQVELIYGSQYTILLSQDLAELIQSFNLPQNGTIAVAPYQNLGQFGAWQNAAFPAGYPGSTNPGNRPVDFLNDWQRHYLVYGADLQLIWQALSEMLAGTSLGASGYEGALTSILQSGPYSTIIQNDMFNHESYRYLAIGYLLGLQRGHPNVANSGLEFFSWFCDYLGATSGPMYQMGYSPAQPIGSSLSNQFITSQGGYPANGNPNQFFQTNTSPGLTGLQDWIGNSEAPTLVYDSDRSSGNENQVISTMTSTSIYTSDFSSGIESQVLTTMSTSSSIYTNDSASGIEFQIIASESSLFFGPTSGLTGQALTYTVIPGLNYLGIVTPNASMPGGQFIPQFLYWNDSSAIQTFVFVPEQPGIYTISLFSNPNIPLLNVPITVIVNSVAAQSAILTGPQLTQSLGAVKVQIGVPSQTFTVTPNGPYTGIVTPSDSNLTLFSLNTGTFNPPFLSFSNSSIPQTFTYTATTMGYKQISISASPFITVSIPILVDAQP